MENYDQEFEQEDAHQETREMVKVAEEEIAKLHHNQSLKKLHNNDSIVNVVIDEPVAPTQDQLTDDVIYNRLPKNFFVKDVEEQLDLDEVMESIKRMR